MDEELLAKQPPQSLEAERAVLGSITLTAAVWRISWVSFPPKIFI